MQASRTKINEAARELENANALIKILSIVAADDTLENMLDQAVDELLSVSWLSLLPKGGIFIVDETDQSLHLVAKKNLSPELHTLCAQIPLGHCLCGRAAASGKTQYAHCIDARHDVSFETIKPHGHYNVPIKLGAKVLGVLVVYLPHGHVRDAAEISFLESVANTLSLVIQVKKKEMALKNSQQELQNYLDDLDMRNATLERHAEELVGLYETQNELLTKTEELEQKALYESRHDPLTKLPNRRYFLECCQQALRKLSVEKKNGAFLFVDVDGFKSINDTLGHAAGDELLQKIASRLTENVREGDIVGRFGGDEFVIFLDCISSVHQGEKIARKIVSALREDFLLEEGIASVGASCGVSTYPDHSEKLETLIDLADKAMYAVKSSGKNGARVAPLNPIR